VVNKLEINRYISQANVSIDIWLNYQYIGIGLGVVDKTLLHFSHIQTTCTRKHNEASQQLSYSNASRCVFINKQTRLTMEHALAVTAETKAS